MIECSICGTSIEKDANGFYGHNPEPVSDGRCCNTCNDDVVIRYRIMLAMGTRKDK